jgi:hypothetical protein
MVKQKSPSTPLPIEENYVKGRQSIEFHGLYKLDKFKVKINIDVDSYDFQSSATAYLFDGLRWNQLANIHYSEMKSKGVSIYSSVSELSKQDKQMFQDDINHLLKLSMNILF